MGCAHPLEAYRGANGTIVFDRAKSLTKVPFPLPCGRCMGCRLEHARQWAVRCEHEQKMWSSSEFITCTYDDQHLPENGSLVREDPQLFLKRLRKKFKGEDAAEDPDDGKVIYPIRFFGCGEYGERTNRPHYHFILFNYFSHDKQFYKKSANGDKYYTSKSLDETWQNGQVLVADVTFKSCAYVAGYVTGKITGDKAEDHYMGRLPEFSMMSRRPGIGAFFFAKYGFAVYQHDSVVANGREMRPSRYYDDRFKKSFPDALTYVKRERRAMARANKADNTPERLAVKEKVLRLNLRKREFL